MAISYQDCSSIKAEVNIYYVDGYKQRKWKLGLSILWAGVQPTLDAYAEAFKWKLFH